MSQEQAPAEVIPPVPEKTEEQIQEEKRKLQEEAKLREEERIKAAEEARIKQQQDRKKLDEALKGGLSSLNKTANCRSMAYTKLSISEKQIERLFPISEKFREIRYLDVSTNNISDLKDILDFPHLVSLNAAKNQVPSLQIFNSAGKLETLQILNLSTNKIKKLETVNLPALRRLNLTENQISEVAWKGHDALEVLELRKNKLKKLSGILNMKNLKELYVCENQITDIRGLSSLPQLWKLSVRNNKIKKIFRNFPFLPNLVYLNLRENQLSAIIEIQKIDSHVKTINFLQNPLADELGENTKKQIIWKFPHFIKVNKSEVTVEDRVAFEKQRLEKQAAEQQARRIAAEEAQKAAEQAQKAAAEEQARRAEEEAKNAEKPPE